MSRITKTIASEIALKLTQAKRIELEKLNLELTNFYYEFAKKQVPTDIFNFYTKNRRYFKTTNKIRFIGNGFNYETVYFNPCLPNADDYYMSIEPSKEIADEILLKQKTIKTKKVFLENLETEIENTLLSISSYKRCENEFPEAFKLLPTKTNNQLIVNVSDIRKKLI